MDRNLAVPKSAGGYHRRVRLREGEKDITYLPAYVQPAQLSNDWAQRAHKTSAGASATRKRETKKVFSPFRHVLLSSEEESLLVRLSYKVKTQQC